MEGEDGDAVRKTPSVRLGSTILLWARRWMEWPGGRRCGGGRGRRLKPALGFVSALRLRTI